CWAASQGYKCCKAGAKVVLTDSKGKWGVENNQWCGIVQTSNASNTCWASSQGYKCCNGCNPIYTDGSRRWGVENNQWCGII
ncbi:Non-catalytic module family DOC2, partial [Piromyces sp. E2]